MAAGPFDSRDDSPRAKQPAAIACDDLKGDGNVDLGCNGHRISVLLGNDYGTFGAPTTYWTLTPVTES